MDYKYTGICASLGLLVGIVFRINFGLSMLVGLIIGMLIDYNKSKRP